MLDFVIAGIIIGAITGAIIYIKKEKKQGIKCVGCPYAKTCSNKENCNH